MFGFGMSSRDKWHLGQVELMIASISTASGQDAKILARQLFDSTKAEIVGSMGETAYAENFGDKLIENKKEAVEKRVSAGLSVEDIRDYWNQTPLIQNLRNKILEYSDFIAINVAQQLGKSDEEIHIMVAEWRRTKPRWGDPEQWNPALPINMGFSLIDADIYIEFYLRVNRWMEKAPGSDQKVLLKNFTSYNSMIRDLVKNNEL